MCSWLLGSSVCMLYITESRPVTVTLPLLAPMPVADIGKCRRHVDSVLASFSPFWAGGLGVHYHLVKA